MQTIAQHDVFADTATGSVSSRRALWTGRGLTAIAVGFLGAVLLTGYLGGAIATHVRVESPLFSHVLFPIYVATFLWAGLGIRDNRLRMFLPWRVRHDRGVDSMRATGTKQTISRDGTPIAYETSGTGPALILVDGALCSRSFGPMPKLAPRLAKHFTVYMYDRRGRGESGDRQPYSREREVEDLAALIQEAASVHRRR